MKFLVERHHDRTDRMNVLSPRSVVVVGMNQLDVVAALGQDANQLT